MLLSRTERGECLYDPGHKGGAQIRLAGNYADCPPDHLWIGRNHRLSRDEMRQFAAQLMAWVEAGTMTPKS
jgi:hypothetical protein